MSNIISLGIGSPASIPVFVLVGLSPGEEAPFIPVVTLDLRTTFDQTVTVSSSVSQTFSGRSVFDASIDLQGNLH
jgi:hypothetical protein